jgi:hypothetical protein
MSASAAAAAQPAGTINTNAARTQWHRQKIDVDAAGMFDGAVDRVPNDGATDSIAHRLAFVFSCDVMTRANPS